MPSVSKKQQRFFQLVKAVQDGKVKKKDVTKSVKDVANSMTKKQVSDFADYRSTKRRVKKVSENNIGECKFNAMNHIKRVDEMNENIRPL